VRQVEYDYDGLDRLITVTTDLTPADGSIADGVVFVTNYAYEATTARIASVTQSDGTSVFFTYGAAGRVSTVEDHGGATSAQLVFSYSTATSSTAVTDGDGQVWSYRYDPTSQQLTEILTPAVGGAALSTKFSYDASGNLAAVTDARNNTLTYGYDSNGNRTLERDALANTVTGGNAKPQPRQWKRRMCSSPPTSRRATPRSTSTARCPAPTTQPSSTTTSSRNEPPG
jgi:YD repeat-containing protein